MSQVMRGEGFAIYIPWHSKGRTARYSFGIGADERQERLILAAYAANLDPRLPNDEWEQLGRDA